MRVSLLALLIALASAFGQEFEGKTLVGTALVADTSAVVPGKPFTVGVVLDMAQGWHTYWQNPGDSGVPTRVDWILPEGFRAGPLQWPLPERMLEPGDLEVFAYHGKVMLMAEITPPKDLPAPTITIGAKLSWLVCEEICVPGKGEATLPLPVAASASPANVDLFATFRARLPKATPPPFPVKISGPDITVEYPGQFEIFPLPAAADSAPVGRGKATTKHGETVFHYAQNPPSAFLVVSGEGDHREAWAIDGAAAPAAVPAERATVPAIGLWKALIYGFLGGLILNLMPCVLPVISLKIFGFMKQAGDEAGKIFRHGLAFVAGIFVWFLALGFVVIGIRASGGAATWAFQFQSPYFNLIIGAIVVVFALNLFGVFEIVLPGRAGDAASGLAGRGGYGGSFFQGVFATLLATPCTAPFLGTALGFAFGASPAIILGMFAAIAAGMASPYLLLSAQPGWMKLLPRPGAWMERVKQFMGFPLLATAVWLLFILGGQKGTDGVLLALSLYLSLGFACWILGSFSGPTRPAAARWTARLLALAVAAGGAYAFGGAAFSGAARGEGASPVAADAIRWVPFSEAALKENLAAGKSVFVDFTADWCLTCKFNERTAINTAAVRAAFAKSGIVPMKADWTNQNAEITAALKRFGRVGVPFYVLYPASDPGNPIILPELLTESIVLEALSRIK